MKKFISLIIICLFLFPATVIPVSAANYVYGDLNNDNIITANDALIALQFSVNKITLSSEKQTCGNVDGTSGITASDALFILQRAVNKLYYFPIEPGYIWVSDRNITLSRGQTAVIRVKCETALISSLSCGYNNDNYFVDWNDKNSSTLYSDGSVAFFISLVKYDPGTKNTSILIRLEGFDNSNVYIKINQSSSTTITNYQESDVPDLGTYLGIPPEYCAYVGEDEDTNEHYFYCYDTSSYETYYREISYLKYLEVNGYDYIKQITHDDGSISYIYYSATTYVSVGYDQNQISVYYSNL